MHTKFVIEYQREYKGNRTREIIASLSSKFKSTGQFEARFESLCSDVAQEKDLIVNFHTTAAKYEVASFIEKHRPI